MTYLIPCEQIDDYWPHVKQWIAQAVHYSDKFSLESVYVRLKAKDFQLWVYENKAAGITHIEAFPLKTTCTLLFAGGESLEGFFESLKVVEEWAKWVGCDSVEICGRKAWARLLPDYTDQLFLSKDI